MEKYLKILNDNLHEIFCWVISQVPYKTHRKSTHNAKDFIV